MTIYTCEHNLTAMLTAIYEAWTSRKGQQNVKLMLEPIEQYTLFEEYIHVDADPVKAGKVQDAVCQKISPAFYRELAYSSMAYEEDICDNLYRMMLLGFAFGPEVINKVQYRAVMRNQDIRCRLGREVNRFQEFSRFHKVGPVYVAHIEPKSRLISALGPIFMDRMPSENWMIVDDVHREVIVHPVDEPFYLWEPDEEEYMRLLETEQENDEFTDLWKVFFHSVSIEQRENINCQLNHFPLWTRKHVVEFH